MHNLLITTECVADLPEELLRRYDIQIIYYDVATEEGVFKDSAEIDARNLIDYISDGKKKAYSVVPKASDYKNFFNKGLAKYDEILHICISSGISAAYENAEAAKAKMGINGRKVKILDSRHLSSGQGILTVEAAKLRDEGYSSMEIIDRLEKMIPNIETSFIAYNADYLYLNGKVDKTVKNVCNILSLHPVLYMNDDGRLTIKRVYVGNYERACRRYIRNLLTKNKNIDNKMGFLTYAGCTHEKLDRITEIADKYVKFDEVFDQQASATVSCNCGPNTFGILFKRNEK